MAGALKFRSKPKLVRNLALPGEQTWELWSYPGAEEGRLERQLAGSELGTLPAETRLAVPIRETLSAAIWLQTADASLFPSMIPVQLEKQGLIKTAEAPPPYYSQLIVQEDARSLLFVLMISPEIPEFYCQDLTGDYDFSARCLPLPPEGYTLWKEEEGLALALVRGGAIASLISFRSPSLTETIAREVYLFHLRLTWEEVASPASGVIHLRGQFLPEEREWARRILKTEPILLSPTPPVYQPQAAVLAPTRVLAARNQRQKRLRGQSLLGKAALIYLILVAVLIADYGWLMWQSFALNRRIAVETPTVTHLSEIADRWHALQPAIDPHFYPLETLLACVQSLPPEARLTQYEHDPGKALILGETADAANAFLFLNAIQAHPEMKRWSWVMPQPVLLPSGRARFQLEGTHRGAPTQ